MSWGRCQSRKVAVQSKPMDNILLKNNVSLVILTSSGHNGVKSVMNSLQSDVRKDRATVDIA